MSNNNGRPDGWTAKNDWEPTENSAEKEESPEGEENANEPTKVVEEVGENSNSNSSEDNDKPAAITKTKRVKRENLRKRSSDDDSEKDSDEKGKKSRKTDGKKSRSPKRRRRSRSDSRHRDRSRHKRRTRSRSRDRHSRSQRRKSESNKRSKSRSTSKSKSSPTKKLKDDNDTKVSDKNKEDGVRKTSQSPGRKRSRSRSRKRRSRSRSRKRQSKSRDRKRRSRSHSRSRRRRSGSGSRSRKRRSRSRSRKRRSRSRSRKRRSRTPKRSRSRSRKRRSRSRKRSRSRSRRQRSNSQKRSLRRKSRSRSKEERRPRRSRRSSSTSPYRFGYDKAMDAQERLARRLERAKELTKIKHEEEKKKLEENGLLGLKDDKLKEAIEKAAKMLVQSAQPLTDHSAMSAAATAQMEELRAKAKAETGISVPTYYNPLVVNPMTYAQQQAKRKKLWSKANEGGEETAKPESDNSTLWSQMSLGDNKSDEKFAKLMGIKQTEQAKQVAATSSADETIKKQQELFTNLDIQYEQARVATHTQRGVGLGFSSAMVNPNTVAVQQANQQLSATTSPVAK